VFAKEVLVANGRQLIKQFSFERVKVSLQYLFQTAMNLSKAL